MKKLLITIILLTLCSVHAQTDEKETLKQLNQKVIASYRNQKFDEALKLAQQAVDSSLRIYGAEQPETAETYRNLGVMYQETKKYKQSTENLQKAVNIYQKMFDSKYEELVLAYQILAYSQFLDNKKEESEANYLKAVEASENKFGKESKESLSPILYLANFYARTKNNEKADELYIKGYNLAKKYFGEETNEFELVSIYRRYYSVSNHQTNNDKNKEFKKKYAEIVGYEIGDAIRLIQPDSPTYTLSRIEDGKIIVKVWVDEKGDVKDAKSVYGHLKYSTLFEEAAKKSKFKPTKKNGKPIPVVNFITYNFQYNRF